MGGHAAEVRSGKLEYAFLYGQASADVMSRDGLCLFGSSVLVVVEAGEPSAESIVYVGSVLHDGGERSDNVSVSCISCFCRHDASR